MSIEQQPARRGRRRQRAEMSQLSFVLNPEDAAKVLLVRRMAEEVAALYETQTGRRAEEALAIRSPQDAYEFLKGEMEGLAQEQLRTLNLNCRHRIISTQLIYRGNVNTIVVRTAEVFRPAILDNATGLIVAHNHPSGDPNPSPEDAQLTRALVAAGNLLDIELLDHLVIGRGKFVSLKSQGLGFDG